MKPIHDKETPLILTTEQEIEIWLTGPAGHDRAAAGGAEGGLDSMSPLCRYPFCRSQKGFLPSIEHSKLGTPNARAGENRRNVGYQELAEKLNGDH